MGEFQVAKGDTLRVLQPTLLNPDGTVHDLTTATGVTLHILLRDRVTVLTRTMTVVNPPTSGVVQYAWVAADWNEILVGVSLMKYVVSGPSSAQLSFPNDTEYDVLRVAPSW